MYYKNLKIPSIIEIGSHIVNNIDSILKQNHLYFEDRILFTQVELLDLFKDLINLNFFSEIVLVKGGTYEEIQTITLSRKYHDALFVAFGGGSVIDLVKMYAQEFDNPYMTIPSTLSNDAIYSPVARLTQEGEKRSFGVKSPMGIIIDFEIIKQSPEILLLAGIGDLLSNLSAVKDCKLAKKHTDERIDNFALTLSQLSTNAILSFKKEDLKTDAFIEVLANGLIVSGLAMTIDGSSRPASGAEHLISHAIDEYYPDKSTIHGLQVAWAQLMIEKLIRREPFEYERLKMFFSSIGLLEAIEKYIKFSETDFMELIPYAKTIRDRFTILNL